MSSKKFDPLWEIVDEKVALQEQEPDIDVPCPYCSVPLHLGAAPQPGAKVTCGLCGGGSQVVQTAGGIGLNAA